MLHNLKQLHIIESTHEFLSDALGHRNKILRLISRFKKDNSDSSTLDTNAVPTEFLCPITQELIIDPVLCAGKISEILDC